MRIGQKNVQIASNDEFAAICSFLSPDFPIEKRSCWAYAEGSLPSVRCDEPHYQQPIANIEAAPVLGQK